MFLSFIVPVYNVEKYLEECLDSLLDQDILFEDYEIICVNDGSTDRSPEILQRYELNFPNVFVISKANGGLAAARNTGFEHARGEYAWFIDSDDFIQRKCLGKLRNLALQTKSDRISVGIYSYREQLSQEETQKAGQGKLKNNIGLNNIAVWNNLFRREHLIINKLWFHPELRYAEDGIYMFEFSLTRHTEIRHEDVCYFYRLRSASLTSSNSYEAQRNKIDGDFCALLYYKKYYQTQQGDPRDIADKLMANLWHLLYMITQLPAKDCHNQIARLRKAELYPFIRPAACTIHKSYMTDRQDIIGKVFDKIYINLHRPWGFATMILFRKVMDMKKKLVK